MTSYCPQTRFTGMGEDEWAGRDKLRFATEAEAVASLAHLQKQRDDLIATRIVPSPKPWTMIWYFDKDMMGLPPRKPIGKIKRHRK